jgi:uncharacterized membrane protein YbhN (UPF0104 family)
VRTSPRQRLAVGLCALFCAAVLTVALLQPGTDGSRLLAFLARPDYLVPLLCLPPLVVLYAAGVIKWRALAVGLGITFSGTAVAALLRTLQGHWRDVGRAFLHADYLYVVPCLAFLVALYGLRVVRWRLFVRPMAPVAYRDVLSATLIGFMANCVLPLRAGEVIRPYVLHRKSGLGLGHAAGTAIGLERIFDLVGACSLLFLTLALLTGAPGLAEHGSAAGQALLQVQARGKLLAAVVLVGMAGMLVVAVLPAQVLALAQPLLRFLPHRWARPLTGFLAGAIQSVGFLRRPAHTAGALVLTLALWATYPLGTWSLSRAFGLGIPFAGVMLAQVLVIAAVVVPQAPGFIGVFQLAAMTGMRAYGVPQGDAAAFATMLWVLNVLPITLAGLTALWYEGLSLGDLARASQAAAAGVDNPSA